MSCLRLKPLILSLSAVFSLPLYAETAPVTADHPTTTLDDIEVTARHVGERARDIPFTVNVIRARDLENRHDTTLESALWQTPGVNVNSFGGTSTTTMKIRGVGSLNQVGAEDASVLIYENGVPRTVMNVTAATLDMGRVEVLKGPQGTLFGRNSEAGVINLSPNKPELGEFTGYLGAEVGSRGHYQGESVLNIPVDSSFAARAALRYSHDDYPLDNARDGKPVTEPKNLTARISLLTKPTDADEVLLSYEKQRMRDYAAEEVLLNGKRKPSYAVPPGSVNDRRDADHLSLNAHHDFDRFRTSAVWGWGKEKNTMSAPFYDDFLSTRLFGKVYRSYRSIPMNRHQQFQEIRIGSKPQADIFWVAGINHYRARRYSGYRDYFDENATASAMNPYNADIDKNFRHQSTAVFGEITYPITGSLKLTGGLRHSWDKVDYQAHWQALPAYIAPGPRTASDAQTLKENYTTGRVAANWAVTKNVNLYALFAHGHKAAGFSDWDTNMVYGTPAAPYKAAKINSYEAGVKSSFPEAGLNVDAELFLNQIKNDHLYVMIDPTQGFAMSTENFDTESRGAEVSVQWQAHPRLTLGAALAYVDAKITGVPEGSKSAAKKGNRTPDVPKFSYTLSAEYRQALPSFWGMSAPIFNAYLGYQGASKRAADVENNFKLNRASQLNARLGLTAGQGEVYLWGNNLLDHHLQTYGYFMPATPPAYGGTGRSTHMGGVSAGRSFGIGARYAF